MKPNPVDGGRYLRSVKDAKQAAKVISRKVEANYNLPRGSVKICLTKFSDKQRDKLAATVA